MGTYRGQLQACKVFPRASATLVQLVQSLGDKSMFTAVSQSQTYLIAPLTEFSRQMQFWFLIPLHLSTELLSTVLFATWTELENISEEVSFTRNLGTPHLDLTLYRQVEPFFRVRRRRHWESPGVLKFKLCDPHCAWSKGQTRSLSTRVMLSYLLEQTQPFVFICGHDLEFWQQTPFCGIVPENPSSP